MESGLKEEILRRFFHRDFPEVDGLGGGSGRDGEIAGGDGEGFACVGVEGSD